MPDDTHIYVNGRFVSRAGADWSVEDRAGMFGDAVYEVIRYHAGRPVAMGRHVARLRRSLAGIELQRYPKGPPSRTSCGYRAIRP